MHYWWKVVRRYNDFILISVKNNSKLSTSILFFPRILLNRKVFAKRSYTMRKLVILLVVGLTVLFISACSTVSPVAGATGKVGSKTGEATQTFICGFPLKGEGGIYQAAKNGGITTVGTVDLRMDYPASTALAVYYYKVTTVVSGE